VHYPRQFEVGGHRRGEAVGRGSYHGAVSDSGGWRSRADPTLAAPLPNDPDRNPQDQFVASPFQRLARTHALSTAADAMVATALAGTVFFQGATSQARGKVFLYLLLTMAPFALVSPLIGPALDRVRSGRRWMIVMSTVLRMLLMLVMIRDVKDLLFYPEAFAVLVLQKAYSVARSAIVPNTIKSDAELVEANSKLALISGLMGFVGAAPAALLFRLGGPGWSLGLASATFLAASVVGLRLPREPIAEQPADASEKAELRSIGVLLAASAMGLIRGIVGFLTLLLAFDFRRTGVPKWHFALVAGVSVGGSLVGAAVAPRLRKVASEERILIGVLVTTVVAGFLAVGLGGLVGATLLGLAAGIASVAGKLAFDSIVQRDAPDANRGRSFAKFETRFQVIWVLGALIGLIEMPVRAGFLIVTLVAGFAAASYALGSLAWKHRSGINTPATVRAVEIEERLTQSKAAARRGLVRSFQLMRQRLNQRGEAAGSTPGDAVPPAPPPFGPPPSFDQAPSDQAPTFDPPPTFDDDGPTAPAPLEEAVTEDTPHWGRRT